MIHNIASNIQSLAVDIELLKPLEVNARRGNVEAIMASYNKFGQVKPIVAVEDGDKLLVIAGNHQLEAAKRLGWQEIAVSIVDLDSEDALAFSLADNRISELGETDESALIDLLSDAVSLDEDFYSTLGWDDFSIATIENNVISSEVSSAPNDGWTAPQITVNRVPEENNLPAFVSEGKDDTSTQTFNPEGVSTDTIVTQGSTTVGAAGSKNVAIQFTLVFENTDQQAGWYRILHKLKESPAYEGATTTELLFDFFDQHLE